MNPVYPIGGKNFAQDQQVNKRMASTLSVNSVLCTTGLFQSASPLKVAVKTPVVLKSSAAV